MRVLLLGSGPNAIQAASWDKSHFDRIVVINNAWRIRPDWDDLIYPEDFAEDRRPAAIAHGQSVILADKFVPAQNAYGGFLYAGATMAYTAAYWALHALRPTVIAFMGCDMVYAKTGSTHFYGTGTADPLRDDISLRSLEAKSARLSVHAARQGCATVNLSVDPSRLALPRATPDELSSLVPSAYDQNAASWADAEELALGYTTPKGWHDHLTDTADLMRLDQIDAAWLRAIGYSD